MKHFEFWSPRLFEAPYYLYLGLLCLRHGLGIRDLAKANYALDHGEIGIGSKLATQEAFDQSHFLPAIVLEAAAPFEEKIRDTLIFAEQHGWPLILKPDMGCVGKGVSKLDCAASARARLRDSVGDQILQKFTAHNVEYGVFFVRVNGHAKISGINKKHFPTIIGDGTQSIQELAEGHDRYTAHWPLFLQYLDTTKVLKKGETFQLSFIGSHTMGCKFTNDHDLHTPALERAILDICNSQPGFNFGRLDVKCESEKAFQEGKFVVIEVNGVASLPTHMFDPAHSLREGYSIFMEHARYLAQAAADNRQQAMHLLPYKEIIQRVKQSQQALDGLHASALNKPL